MDKPTREDVLRQAGDLFETHGLQAVIRHGAPLVYKKPDGTVAIEIPTPWLDLEPIPGWEPVEPPASDKPKEVPDDAPTEA